jgi:hypothetical protein
VAVSPRVSTAARWELILGRSPAWARGHCRSLWAVGLNQRCRPRGGARQVWTATASFDAGELVPSEVAIALTRIAVQRFRVLVRPLSISRYRSFVQLLLRTTETDSARDHHRSSTASSTRCPPGAGCPCSCAPGSAPPAVCPGSVPPAGLEPATCRLEGGCSIH